jgi:hypothetical protein
MEMTARYVSRSWPIRWTVYDTRTGAPAVVNRVPRTGLSREEADDLADVLNVIDRQPIIRLDALTVTATWLRARRLAVAPPHG